MNRLHRFIACLFPLLPALGLTMAATAQEEVEYRREIGAAAGVSFSLTDVNSVWYGNTNFSGGAVVRFLLNPRMAVKTSLTYARLSGATSGMKDFFPVDPDRPGMEQLKFKADGGIVDLSAVYELNFLPYGYTQGYQGYKRFVPYIQMGLGLTYADAGKVFTMNVPIGAGLKYKIAPRLNLGLDWLFHLTLSDKLEGLEAPLGIKSSGFRNKDHYGMTLLTLTYDISPRCPTCNRDE